MLLSSYPKTSSSEKPTKAKETLRSDSLVASIEHRDSETDREEEALEFEETVN